MIPLSKAKTSLRIAVGQAPKPVKPGPVMAGQNPMIPLCPDKRGDNGRGPLPKTANGADRNVNLVTPGKGREGPLTKGN